MAPRPTLTLGIPTFERAARLKDCLESIAAQYDPELRQRVEVVVSDNGSTDGTWELLQGYARSHGFRIRRNEKNLGMDLNLLEVNRMAQGEFLWWMGDDDVIMPGYLRYAADLLRAPEADFYFVPAGEGPCRTFNYFGYADTTRGRMWDFLNTHGLFRMFGTIGHCLFRRQRLADYQSLVPGSTGISHVFGLLLSFRQSDALILERSGFDVPHKGPAELANYMERWHRDQLWTWGWHRSGQLLYGIIEQKMIPPPEPRFFRMFVRQRWPFQHHVLLSLLAIAMDFHEPPPADQLERVRKLTQLLRSAEYDALCERVLNLVRAEKENRRQAQDIADHPLPAFPEELV